MGSLRNLGTNKQELKDSMGITNMSPKMIQTTEKALEKISESIVNLLQTAHNRSYISPEVASLVKILSDSYSSILSGFNNDGAQFKEKLEELIEEVKNGKP